MSGSLTDSENFSLGVFAAFIEAICLQPTLYWKNARAQGLPFTLNPRIIYRGTAASVLNEMQMMGMQFGCTGALHRIWMTYMMSSRSKSDTRDTNTKMDMWNELGLVRYGDSYVRCPTLHLIMTSIYIYRQLWEEP